MQGADLTAQDKLKSTPLHGASVSGKVDLAHFFVEHGADTTAKDDHGTTLLHVAVSSRWATLDLMRFLVEYSANTTAQDKDGLTPLHRNSFNGYVDVHAKSDADIIRDARCTALGFPPAHKEEDRQRGPQMVTDKQVRWWQFKKHMHNEQIGMLFDILPIYHTLQITIDLDLLSAWVSGY